MEEAIKLILEENPCLDKGGYYYNRTKEERNESRSRIRPDIIQKVQEHIPTLYNFRKTFNKLHSSYNMKHVIERDLGIYVSNGELIIAMLGLGHEKKHYPNSNPNVYFKVSLIKKN